METIVALVPPVLASIAGIFPILLESLPTSFDAKSKPLAIILLVAGIWVIHILMLSFGYSYTLFSPTITVITLVAGISVLAILLSMSIQQIKIAKSWASMLYISSIIFLVAGFSNYLLMQDNIVLRFTKGDKCTSIVQLQWMDTEDIRVRLDHVNSIFGIGVVWPNERFEKIDRLVIICSNSDPSKPDEGKIVTKLAGVYRPWGAGKSYEFRR